MINLIKQGIEIIILWVKTVLEALPEEVKPGVSIGGVIALGIIIIKLFFPKKH